MKSFTLANILETLPAIKDLIHPLKYLEVGYDKERFTLQEVPDHLFEHAHEIKMVQR